MRMDGMQETSLHLFLSTVASQTDVARMLCVTPSQIGHILAGRRKPSAMMLKLAAYVARYELPVNHEDTDTPLSADSLE